jgi:hypothetical protein
MGRRMDEKRLQQEDKELVLVAFEGEIANLETLVRLAREYGFRKVLSALGRDLQKAQADFTEVIAWRPTTSYASGFRRIRECAIGPGNSRRNASTAPAPQP